MKRSNSVLVRLLLAVAALNLGLDVTRWVWAVAQGQRGIFRNGDSSLAIALGWGGFSFQNNSDAQIEILALSFQERENILVGDMPITLLPGQYFHQYRLPLLDLFFLLEEAKLTFRSDGSPETKQIRLMFDRRGPRRCIVDVRFLHSGVLADHCRPATLRDLGITD